MKNSTKSLILFSLFWYIRFLTSRNFSQRYKLQQYLNQDAIFAQVRLLDRKQIRLLSQLKGFTLTSSDSGNYHAEGETNKIQILLQKYQFKLKKKIINKESACVINTSVTSYSLYMFRQLYKKVSSEFFFLSEFIQPQIKMGFTRSTHVKRNI